MVKNMLKNIIAVKNTDTFTLMQINGEKMNYLKN